MSLAVRGFLRSAVLWLAVGLALGCLMAIRPSWIPLLRAAHLHALLAGFVAFMIFGVGYHVFPRFSGRPLPWPRGPLVHLVLANAGVLAMVCGFLARGPARVWSPLLAGTGGVLTLAGAALFIYSVWHLTRRPLKKYRVRRDGVLRFWSRRSPESDAAAHR